MTMLKIVTDALGQWPQPKAIGTRVVVPTHCLTSGGTVIHVVVEGGQDNFVVHDDGAALRIFEDCGGDLKTAPRTIAMLMKPHGFNVDAFGTISAPAVNLAELAPTIMLVANAAREAAEHLIQKWRPVFRKKFKDAVRDLLEAEFPQRWGHDQTVIGKSNKPHHFDFTINLGQERRLFFDAVAPDANAISSTVVRHLDVANAHDDSVIQRIIYDDRVEWKASDLNLLKMGAPPLAFSGAQAALDKLAA